MNSNRSVLRAPIHPPLLKIGSYLDNSLNISHRVSQTCGGQLCFRPRTRNSSLTIPSTRYLIYLIYFRSPEGVGGDRWKQSVGGENWCSPTSFANVHILHKYNWNHDCANSSSFPTFFSSSFLPPWCSTLLSSSINPIAEKRQVEERVT